MKKRFSDEQIVVILREGVSGSKTVAEICREHGISEPTYDTWKRKLGAMEEPEVKRLKELEKENTPVRAEHVNHVWAYDFVFDRCANGRQLNILTTQSVRIRRWGTSLRRSSRGVMACRRQAMTRQIECYP